jgi:acyl-CoA synthetase (AMP-forming)/AMP-acid ligase II
MLFDAIERWAGNFPDRLAIDPIDGPAIAYGELAERVSALAQSLRARHRDGRPVALLTDYGSDEAVLELALLEAGVPTLSLPCFFTPDQRRHAITAAGAAWLYRGGREPNSTSVARTGTNLPEATARITFTSGSTGAAKGVCLSAEHLLTVAQSVVERVGHEHAGRHCALLPPGILLETVAGFYATMLAGGTYVCPRQALAGLGDPFRPDFDLLARHLADWRITSLILVPEYLGGLVRALAARDARLPDLTLVAVGGARVPVPLLEQAAALGLPVLQGYGLTECASVVALQDAGDPVGSTGRPLGHMRATLADDGEILLDGPLCLGTLGSTQLAGPLATGDIGRIDDAGRLWIEGRKSNLIVTSFGRNISPEWIEETLLGQGGIAQAFVHGDGKPFPEALLVPATPSSDLVAAVAAANAALPPYAQVATWREVAHFTPQNGLLTGNGRLRRGDIAARYAEPGPSFFKQLEDGTVRERLAFLAVPQVRAGLAGTIDLATYIAYLGQAYNHVCHTVPLMREARAGLADRPELQAALDDYIAEETGHEEWILSDIAAAGGDAEQVRHSAAHPATQAMVDHAYARIRAGDPVSFFGMVYVLESVSVALASRGASAVAERLGLPPQAFTYLTSHGSLDQSHMRFFEHLVNGLGTPGDQQSILTMAREMFGLFGGMFAAIEMEPTHAFA